MRVILTGATGMVGEGVLLECLQHPAIEAVLLVSRRPYGVQHPKVKECIVPDFLRIEDCTSQLSGYDACFYCAGVSSRGMSEAEYTHVTYEITVHFARVLAGLNPQMIFDFVSGELTDSSEQGKLMWARVKGKTENELMRCGFRKVYNFRPGFMKPTAGQRNVKGYYRVIGGIYPLLHLLFPNHVSTLREVGLAMIHSVLKDYPRQVLEVKDIKALARG
ncbi:NAD-dependent epimerase/dehydratase family protein [Acidipila rosea]|uniref:NAD-dependent epimerase/dehydratase family protein n=1 Tax=Acidipila rosea TaxID=768535 RepID=A0A4R1KZ84_9BACT|nr:NAD-dependent epimerase/dehydratase family protein [Acidipila rosea]TCK70885.1 NAD-dependent epimerase/dehydratase family protein [Acidipila rosea]